jgi:hypothetical protein
MTVETKTTIALDDITTVEFECKNCHTVTAYQIGAFRSPPIGCGCREGREGQWMTFGGDTYTAIANVADLMRRLAAAKNEPFVMRFGLKGVPVSDRASGSKA